MQLQYQQTSTLEENIETQQLVANSAIHQVGNLVRLQSHFYDEGGYLPW